MANATPSRKKKGKNSSNMKLVINEEDGILVPYYVPDHIPDTSASMGVPAMSVNVIHEIDWDKVAIELNNLLVRRRLFTKRDIENANGSLENTIVAVIKRKLLHLYRNN